jgi:hypothetical protein
MQRARRLYLTVELECLASRLICVPPDSLGTCAFDVLGREGRLVSEVDNRLPARGNWQKYDIVRDLDVSLGVVPEYGCSSLAPTDVDFASRHRFHLSLRLALAYQLQKARITAQVRHAGSVPDVLDQGQGSAAQDRQRPLAPPQRLVGPHRHAARLFVDDG